MDVRLSPEQRALRESVIQVVDRFGPRSVPDLDDTERQAKLSAAVEASGWRELRAPTESGAPLASAVEVAIVAEELGRSLADAAFLGPTLAAELRRGAGTTPRSNETVALAPDLSTIGRVAEGSPWPEMVAVDADGADVAVLVASRDASEGVTTAGIGRPGGSVDLTRPSATVAATERRTGGSEGGPLAETDLVRWTALGLVITCADLVGAMRGAIDLATDYARARRQYGVTVGSFQAVQHLLADALVSMEGSRSVTLYAGWATDTLPPADAMAAAAQAKAYCARAARSVCETAIQVHGGIGHTWDCLAHVYLRRCLLSIDILGGVGASLTRVLEARGIGGAGGFR
jgi:alkylation response protein AidB-like acyl-CoA dehydrogenase